MYGVRNTILSWRRRTYMNNLETVDTFEREVANMIDGYIEAHGLDAPAEVLDQLRNGYSQKIITELDLNQQGVSTIIWATGYTFDYSMIKLPVFDQDGFPVQSSGVTKLSRVVFCRDTVDAVGENGVPAGRRRIRKSYCVTNCRLRFPVEKLSE